MWSNVRLGEDICAEGHNVYIPKFVSKGKTYNLIHSGYIHLLRKKYEAEELRKIIVRVCVPVEFRKVDDVVIVRAIVPAGTEYYSGLDGTRDYGSVAVKKVKYELI